MKMTVVLASRCGVDGLGHADGSEVSVALVGKDQVFGVNALHGGCDRRRTTVCGLDHVAGEEVVGHNGAANRGHAHAGALYPELVDDFGYQALHNAVTAAGAVVGDRVGQSAGALENNLFFSHRYSPTFSARASI